MKPLGRFIVSGLVEDALVENHTDDFDHAIYCWDIAVRAGWKNVRIWDKNHERFVPEHVIKAVLESLRK